MLPSRGAFAPLLGADAADTGGPPFCATAGRWRNPTPRSLRTFDSVRLPAGDDLVEFAINAGSPLTNRPADDTPRRAAR
ncbi:MAG TPA: hypothetical protein VFU74_00530 [Actinocrinis sp.]|nr:hypothetical protein [Actinocrinis sp.]